MKRLLLVIFFLLFALPSFSMLKQRFGGNIKVAEELMSEANRAHVLFELRGDQTIALSPLAFERQEGALSVDLSRMEVETQDEVQKWTEELKDPSNACHWILDFPYYDHQHPTTMMVVDKKLVVASAENDYIDALITSPCLLPSNMNRLNAFNRTQFGYEANVNCLMGRPFLDSISPVVVDPANPYLSLKLNDVDIAAVPEDRFNQVSTDPDLNLVDGPKFYVYLVTSGLTEAQVNKLMASIDAQELGKAVLNDHVSLEMTRHPESGAAKLPSVLFSYPSESPYRLLAERLRIEWESAGISFLPPNTSAAGPSVRLSVRPVAENNMDLFRYRLLQDEFSPRNSVAWFDLWDQMESSGKLVPLLIHTSRLAVRKNIQDLRTDADGQPDFAGCWLLP
jgi:hypothetical protein